MSTIDTKPIVSEELSHAGVKGMRWGIRRYQNADGSLTDLGKKRYSKQLNDAYDTAYKKGMETGLKNPKNSADDVRKGATKAAINATNLTEFDSGKEVQKDLDATNAILRETANASGATSNAVKNIRVNVKRLDLSNMTDTEMRQRIAREQLESQYDSMFNVRRHRIENGKQAVASIIAGIGTAAVVTHSALEIARAVKTLKG